jgi:hypothetical protein
MLEASRLAVNDTEIHARIMDEVLGSIRDFRSYPTAPALNRAMHRIAFRHTGVADPYRQVRERDTQAALKLYPMLKRHAAEGEGTALQRAVKIAVTGNVIDSAVGTGVDIERCVGEELGKPFAICETGELERRLKNAKSLLVIGDNAGETVFDRVLLETLPHLDITYAVRSAPILNDATVEDALAAGIGECACVMSTGCDMPGVGLDEVSGDFLRVFREADIVISKGQGNFETLEDSGREIFFLLKAKCGAISRRFEVAQGEYVFRHFAG